MAVVLLPDIEAMTSQYLRQHADVTALVADRVVTILGKDQQYPAVRITRIAGAPTTSTILVLDEAWLQLDVFGGSQKQARDIAATCQAALKDFPSYASSLGRVTGIRFGSFAYQPDEAFSPPKPRYRFDVIVWTRNNPT